MADFTRYSNYSEETGFTSVVFGANAPVLEVELNEMQQILNHKLELFFKFWGNKVLPLKDDVYNLTGNVFTLKNCAVLCDGAIIYVKESKVEVDDTTSGFVYAKVENEKEVTGNELLTSCGDTEGVPIENQIMDNRNPMETSRRKILKFTLVYNKEELPNTDTHKLIKVATLHKNTETNVLTIQIEKSDIVTSADLAYYQKIGSTVEESLLANAVVEPKLV